MDRKRDHELQTNRLVSSGAGASAVSRNTSRAPTEGLYASRDGRFELLADDLGPARPILFAVGVAAVDLGIAFSPN